LFGKISAPNVGLRVVHQMALSAIENIIIGLLYWANKHPLQLDDFFLAVIALRCYFLQEDY